MVSETEMDNVLIKELGSAIGPASTAQSSKTNEDMLAVASGIEFENVPFCTWMYSIHCIQTT